MRNIREVLLVVGCLLANSQAYSQTNANTQAHLNQIITLKLELYNDLNNADIISSTFDDKTEFDIAKTEMAIANYYLSLGDRKNAVISAIIARKILQRIYGNPYDPSLIPIYSLLVKIYESKVDVDTPNVDASDALQAKKYREAIDHIHAQ